METLDKQNLQNKNKYRIQMSHELIKRYNEGEEHVKEKLIELNFDLIASVIYKQGYNNYPSIDVNDLIQEGVIALIDAIDKYNLDYKIDFVSFAKHTIKICLLKYLLTGENAFIITDKAIEKINILINKHGRRKKRISIKTDIVDFLDDLHLSRPDKQSLSKSLEPKERYYEGFTEESNNNLLNIISNNECLTEEDDYSEEIWKELKELLTERQYAIVLLRNGKSLDGKTNDYPKILEEVAKVLGMSQETIRKEEINAYDLLREYFSCDKDKKELLFRR